jgi:hypothetical protein
VLVSAPTPNFNLVTVFGHFEDYAGSNMTGFVSFTPSAILRDLADKTTLFPSAFTKTLSAGSFTIDLPATDDPDILGTPFTYTYREHWTGGRTMVLSIPVATPDPGFDITRVGLSQVPGDEEEEEPPGGADTLATVTTYPAPSGAPTQSVYTVTVNGAASPVYPTFDNVAVPQPHWGKFTIFSMTEGAATVSVTTNYDVSSVKIRPTIQNVTATITGARSFQFTITRTGNYSVEVNADPLQTDQTKPGSTNQIDPLFIFASPPETKPSPTDPNVYAYLAAGQVYAGGSVVPGNGSTVTIPASGDLVIPTGKTVYIEGGAWLRGRLITGATSATGGTVANNVTIGGRGVVDASWQTPAGNAMKVYRTNGTTVSDLVFLSCNKWAFRVFGSGSTGAVSVNRVRVLSWANQAVADAQGQDARPDGMDIVATSNLTIDGCFVRARDDAITFKANRTGMDGDWEGNCQNNTVRNAVLWNGDAGNAMEIGFETGNLAGGGGPWEVSNITLEHSDIIHKTVNPANVGYTGAPATNYRRGALSIHNEEAAGNVHDVLYNNIRIEDIVADAGQSFEYNDGILHFRSMATNTTTDNIIVRDVSVFRSQAALSWQVRGFDSTYRVTDVAFENFSINGTVISDSTIAAANGYVSANVSNVTFAGSQVGGPTGVTLAPAADAWIRNNGTQSGTETYLRVKNSTTNTLDRASYLKFDMTATGLSSCSAAKLRLWLVGNDSGAATTVAVNSVADNSWGEATITWLNSPPSVTAISSVSVGSQQAYYEWTVTSWVNTRLAADKVVSFQVADGLQADNQLVFASRDAAANIPQLVLTP